MKLNTNEILLVEDNPSDVKLTLNALKKFNLSDKVSVVKDGEEALDYIFARGNYITRNFHEMPKVIFLDLKLPKINGLEVLKIIKDDDKTKNVPVVILSSSKEDKDIAESYRLGVNSYIVKPVEFDSFINSVSQLGLYWLCMNEVTH